MQAQGSTTGATSGARATDQGGLSHYEIRIEGHLDARWVSRFSGLSLANDDDGTTRIHGPVVDQAALHGLLQQLRDIGIPLLSVTQVRTDAPDDATTHHCHPTTPSATPATRAPREEPDMTTIRTTAPRRVPMTAMRKTALAGGLLYLATFVTSIPALALKDAARHNLDFMLGSGSASAVTWGAVLDVVLALVGVGTAIALYPVTKRQSQVAGLGFVTSRLTEAAMILVGCLTLFTMVTLRQDMSGATGAEAASLVTTGKSLIAMHNWTFLLGPGLMSGVNALFLGSVMYRSRLVPRLIPLVGLIGAPLLIASSFATMFGLWDQVSKIASVLTLPVALWELSLGLWLTFKGFTPSPVLGDDRAERTPRGTPVPAAA